MSAILFSLLWTIPRIQQVLPVCRQNQVCSMESTKPPADLLVSPPAAQLGSSLNFQATHMLSGTSTGVCHFKPSTCSHRTVTSPSASSMTWNPLLNSSGWSDLPPIFVPAVKLALRGLGWVQQLARPVLKLSTPEIGSGENFLHCLGELVRATPD